MRLIFVCVVTMLLLAACVSTPPPPGDGLVIRNVTVLEPVDGSARVAQDVFIRSGRVVDVVNSGAAPVAGWAQVVDARGQYLLPGMWDLHTHLSFAVAYVGPLLVTRGVTGARDMGAVLEEIEAIRGAIERGERWGPRIVRAGPTLNGAEYGDHQRLIETPAAARAAVAELAAAGVDVLKTHNATAREVYFALLEAADAAGLEVVGHIPKVVTPLEACRAGQASIDHIVTLFEGTYQRAFASEAESFLGLDNWLQADAPALIDCMVEEGTLFVPTLYTYYFRAHRGAMYDNPPAGFEYLTAESRARYREEHVPSDTDRNPRVIELRAGLVKAGQLLTRMLHEAGATIGAGTDFAGSGMVPGYSLHREVELMVEGGLAPHGALRAATRGPGTGAGADPLTGSIVGGAPADLVLLRENPFADVAALSAIAAVVLRGRLLDREQLDAIEQALAADRLPVPAGDHSQTN